MKPEHSGRAAGAPSVVWVSHFVPFPPIGGCFQRSYHLLRRLAQWHELHLVAIRHKAVVHKGVSLEESRAALSDLFDSVSVVDLSARTQGPRLLLGAASSMIRTTPFTVSLYDHAQVRTAIAQAVARYRPDILHLDTIGLAQYADLAGTARTVLGHHNVESAMMQRRIGFERNPGARIFYGLEAGKLRRYETRWCRRVDANVVVSRLDGETLQAAGAVDEFSVVANGVDVNFLTPVDRTERSNTLIFAGRLDQYANRDGIVHFVGTAWDRVRAAVPDARLVIAGANPPAVVSDLASTERGITVTGFVDDIRPCFAGAAATVIPLRDGGGTRLKVLDALALGMPIVSTSLGIEGLDLEPERDVLVADAPDTFASQITRLLGDIALQRRLAVRAREVAVERFGWDQIARNLSRLYQKLGERSADTVVPVPALHAQR